MAGFQDDPLVPGFYSELHFADEVPGLETDGSCFGFSSTTATTSFSLSGDGNNSPRMLCFGDYATITGLRSGPACTGSAPFPSANKTKNSTLPTSNKKRDGSGSEWNQNPGVNAGASTGNQRNSKKPKSENATVTGPRTKVAKKEKLGERITALQQLVSPFGKTDTASVLHEALGYIKFLQDQVKVLCSPYLHNPVNVENKEIERADGLRSRGLCLVPVELTLRVADSNGADLWSSVAMVNNDSSNC